MRSCTRLEEALKSTGIPVKYYEYAGTEPEYIVYNEELEQPVNFGDNVSQNEVTWWQVHIFAPKNADFRTRKDAAKTAVTKAGFMITDIKTLYEKETKTIHVVINCHAEERED